MPGEGVTRVVVCASSGAASGTVSGRFAAAFALELEVVVVFALVVELDDHFAAAHFGAGEGVAPLGGFDAEVADFGSGSSPGGAAGGGDRQARAGGWSRLPGCASQVHQCLTRLTRRGLAVAPAGA